MRLNKSCSEADDRTLSSASSSDDERSLSPRSLTGMTGFQLVSTLDSEYERVSDYRMGGQAILPPACYVKMVLDAVQSPCELLDVEFKAVRKLDEAGDQAMPSLFIGDEEEAGHAQSFYVSAGESKYCVGYVREGLPGPLVESDIGTAGLAALVARHGVAVVESQEAFYGVMRMDGVVEYGPSFRTGRSLHRSLVDSTFLARFDVQQRRDASPWVVLLDGLYQLGFLLPSQDPEVVQYPGGFKAAQILGEPCTSEVYAHVKNVYQVEGNKKTFGDCEVYDGKGNLVLEVKGLYTILADRRRETTQLCQLVWQPRLSTTGASYREALQAAREAPAGAQALAVASALQVSIEQLRSRSAPAVVWRILEVVNAAEGPSVAEVLSRVGLRGEKEGVIVEVFLASHCRDALHQLARDVDTRGPTWLRLRKLHLPALEDELGDVCFDAVIIHGAMWGSAGDGEAGTATQSMARLCTFLVPGAQMFVMGATDSLMQDTWLEQLRQYGEAEVLQGASCVMGRFDGLPRGSRRRDYLFVAEEASVAARLESLVKAADDACYVHTLSLEDSGLDGRSGSALWAEAVGRALSAMSVGTEGVFEGVVFLAGLSDETVLGTRAFGRLVGLCQGLMAHRARLSQLYSNGKLPSLWVITQGAFTGRIRPSQAALQSIITTSSSELRVLTPRAVDMTSWEELSSVAEVLVQSPREVCGYLASPKGVMVPRLVPAATSTATDFRGDVFRPDACYLVTGGAGGFGACIIRHAFHRGARHFVVSVTHGPERVHALFSDLLSSPDCTIEAVVADVSRERDTARLLRIAKSQCFPLTAIFHAAGVSASKPLSRLAVSDFEKVAGPKAMGAHYLHQHSLDTQLEVFAVISSVVSFTGGYGTTSYTAANAFLDGLIRLRRSMGLCGTAFNMGALSDVGILFNNYKLRQLQSRLGIEVIPSRRAVQELEHAITLGIPQAVEMFFRQEARSALYPNWTTFLHCASRTLVIGGTDSEEDALPSDVAHKCTGASTALPAPTAEPAATSAALALPSSPRKVTALSNGPAAAEQQALAIIGMGCRFPGDCDDAGAFWDFLMRGGDGIVGMPVDRWPAEDAPRLVRRGGFLRHVDMFDAGFFGLSTDEALVMDPQQRLLTEVAQEALCDAGYSKAALAGSSTGVFMGLTSNGMNAAYSDVAAHNLYIPLGCHPCFASNRLSHIFSLHGPSLTLDTACASSLTALDVAADQLRSGSCTQALVGAVSVYGCPRSFDILRRLNMLSPDGRCKAFDATADGYVRAEGCGVILVKPLSDAQRDGDRIHAVIRGTAINHVSRAGAITTPSGPAQHACISRALQRAGVHPDDVAFVEAHGTGTAIGDPVEFAALSNIFATPTRGPSRPLAIGAVKSNIGHLEDAAGMAGLIKAVLVLKNRCVPPNLHLNALNPRIDTTGLNPTFPTHPVRFRPPQDQHLIAVVNSAGFGGANAAVVLEQAPQVTGARAPLEPPRYRRKRYPWLASRAAPHTVVNQEAPKPQQGKLEVERDMAKPLQGIAGELASISSPAERVARLTSHIEGLIRTISAEAEGPLRIAVDAPLFLQLDSISCAQLMSRLMASFPMVDEDSLTRLEPEQTTIRTIVDVLLSSLPNRCSRQAEEMIPSSEQAGTGDDMDVDVDRLTRLHPDVRQQHVEDVVYRLMASIRPMEKDGWDTSRFLSDYLDSIRAMELFGRLEEALPFVGDVMAGVGARPGLTTQDIVTDIVAHMAKQPESYENNAVMAAAGRPMACLPLFRRKQSKQYIKPNASADGVDGSASVTLDAREPVKHVTVAEEWVKVVTPSEDVHQRLLYVPWNGQMWRFPNTMNLGVVLPRPLDPTRVDPETRDIVLCARRVLESLDLLGLLDKPLVVFGHCFGAFLALEICRQLELSYGITAKRLVVSSMVVAPSKTFLFSKVKKAARVPDFAIKYGMVKLQLAPTQLLERHPADVMVAMFKSNHLAWDRYNLRCHTPGERLRCPISVVHGTRDTMFRLYGISLSNSKAWQEFTQLPLEVKRIPGDHSYFLGKDGAPVIYAYMKQLLA